MAERTAGVYEMLWDCAYCGTRKLLGKTHRFCPKCGAPQDPTRRYFPAEDEKVAVEDHVFVGADRLCPACGSAMSARAAHCTQCGSPLEGATAVGLVGEPTLAPPPPRPASPPNWRRRFVVLGVLAAVVGLIVLLTSKKQAEARVAGHTWERTIAVESFAPRSESAWCDSLPADAYRVSRSREVRSHRQIPDGEECSTRRVDNGDGTFREVLDCKTRYRSEPVYDDRCHFTVNRWSVARKVKAVGAGLAAAPHWPELTLRAGTCLGCEREGERGEVYRVQLQTTAGKALDCAVSEARWREMAEGSRWTVKVGLVTGSPACDSLRPAP
jgi:predicted RNA-binding Zn-ribbon protein involved in translation (DUF1610 family)